MGEKSRVTVKMRRYKLELKGYITQIDEDSFQLQIGPDRLETGKANERLVTIRYAEVEKVRGPRSRAANIAVAIKTDSSAEAVLSIERQAVWPQWDYIYRLDHQATGTVLAAGKVRAIDGGAAAKQIAQQIVARIAQASTKPGNQTLGHNTVMRTRSQMRRNL